MHLPYLDIVPYQSLARCRSTKVVVRGHIMVELRMCVFNCDLFSSQR